MKRKSKIIFLIIIFEIMIVIYIMLFFKVQSRPLYEGDVYEFNDNWTMTIDNGEPQKLDALPYKGNSEAYSEVVISNVIPKEYAGLTMYFLTTDKIIWVYVDDECVYQFGVNDKKSFGKSPGTILNFVDIPQDLQEGKIRIVSKSPFDNMASTITEIKVAKRDIAVLRLLVNNVFELLCSIALFLITIVLVICGFISKAFNEDGEGAFFMAIFSFTAGIYYLIQSRLLFIFYGNALTYQQITFAFLMQMPLLQAEYYKANLPKKYSKYLNGVLIVGVCNLVLQQMLYILNLGEYHNMMMVSHIIIAIGFLIASICFIDMMKTPQRKKAVKGLTLLLIIFGGSIADILRAYFIVSAEDMGKYSRITAVIYCFALHVHHMERLIEKYSDKIKENTHLLERENIELTKARDEAEEAKQDAIRANQAKSNFLAHISHEIRTPINAVLGMDNMILRESKDETIKGYAVDIRNAGNTLLALINDILDFSKMESGNLEIIPAEYDLSSTLHDLINMIEPRARKKNLEFITDIDESIPSRLYGDDVRIRQIIINILTNAVKYTEKGTVSFSVKSKTSGMGKILLCVAVSDTGIGIREEDIENITVAFKRVDESRNRHIEGTGLGMNITVQLLGLMNSELKIESEYGKGSTFSFELEQEVINASPIGKFSERLKHQSENFKYKVSVYAPKACVLVVDDNEMNRKVFKGLLKHTGVQITEAESGYEGLDLVQNEYFDIIFMDHMMPGMDGIETLERMKEMEHKCKDTPVIILTANAVVGAREMYLEKGFEDFLPKPVNPDKLEQMISKYLPDNLKEMVDNEVLTEMSSSSSIDEFPMIEGIDWKYAIEHYTDTEYLVETVTSFYYTIEGDIMELTKYFSDIENEESLELYRIKVHAMKTTTALIGAMSLSGLARLLEYAARDKELDTIRSLTPVFMRECKKLKDNLEANQPKQEKRTAHNELLVTLFKQLKKKVEELDIDAMDEIVDEIKQYDISHLDSEMKKLLNDVSNIDMEQIVLDVEDIIGKL